MQWYVAPARVLEAATTDAVQHRGYAVMKPEQLQVVSSIILAMMSLLCCYWLQEEPVLHVKAPPAHVPYSCWIAITRDETVEVRMLLPFLQLPCCDLLSPSNTCFNTLLFRLHLSFVSVTLPQARHATAGLSCVDIAS